MLHVALQYTKLYEQVTLGAFCGEWRRRRSRFWGLVVRCSVYSEEFDGIQW